MHIDKVVSDYKGKIGVDMISGDRAPSKILKYSEPALRKVAKESLKYYPNVKFVALGPESELKKYFSHLPNVEIFDIQHTHNNDGVVMDIYGNLIKKKDEPDKYERTYNDPRSAIFRLMKLLRQGEIDAAFTSGNTAIAVKNASRNIGTIDGVLKASLTATVPTYSKNDPSILTDVGANLYTTPLMLYQKAIMASEYYKIIRGFEHTEPRVAILNVGEEQTKGTDLLIDAYNFFEELKRKEELNFVGNIESRKGIFLNKADVIVTDGWTGNVVIKTGEGIMDDLVRPIMRQTLKGNPFLWLAAAFMWLGNYSSQVRQRLSPDKYNGASQIGLKKTVLIGHSTSNRFATAHGIENTLKCAEADLTNRIQSKFLDKEQIIQLKKEFHDPYINPFKERIEEFIARIEASGDALSHEQKERVLSDFSEVFRNSNNKQNKI